MEVSIVISKDTRIFEIGKLTFDIGRDGVIEKLTKEIIDDNFKDNFDFINDIEKGICNDVDRQRNNIVGMTKGLLFICCEQGSEPLRDFLICYNNDTVINLIASRVICQLEDFQNNFNNKDDLDLYILRLDEIIYIFENEILLIEDNTLKEIKEKMLKIYDQEDNVLTIRKRRRYISDILLHNCERWKEEIKKEDEKITSELDEFVAGRTYEQNSFKELGFYKNIIKPDKWTEFEEMTDLIRNELVRFDVNINYCDKIERFINNEFSKDGVFPSDIMFIGNFMDNALSEMTLVATKMYSQARPNSSNPNFGFDYLKYFICASSENKETVVKIMGKQLKELIKEAKELVTKIEILRNAYIAHYDLTKLKEARSIQLDLEEFKRIHSISSRVFEILSLYRFHYYDSAYMNLIKYNGFENIVCKTYYMNKAQKTDLDRYLDVLRLNLKPKFIERIEKVNNMMNQVKDNCEDK